MSRDGDTLFTFYAKDREDAERKSEKILHERNTSHTAQALHPAYESAIYL